LGRKNIKLGDFEIFSWKLPRKNCPAVTSGVQHYIFIIYLCLYFPKKRPRLFHFNLLKKLPARRSKSDLVVSDIASGDLGTVVKSRGVVGCGRAGVVLGSDFVELDFCGDLSAAAGLDVDGDFSTVGIE